MRLKKQKYLRNKKDDVKLTEAIGINCSYETTPLGSKVGEKAGNILVREVRKVLST